ncbi:MAG: HNH endonuclease, partial [Calditrichia bacterium]|nr:HNH endonuclease [Calditrichia bacterium]
MTSDRKIRLAAFNWLSEQTHIHGDVLPRKLLAEGFPFEGMQIALVSPQGIFKLKFLDLPLTITTAPKGPYDDNFGKDGFLLYRYRGTNPAHPDNVGLRKSLQQNIPLIYFLGIVPGKYLAVWPVYIIGDDPINLSFKVAVDDQSSLMKSPLLAADAAGKREYLTAAVKVRLHQRNFREKVLAAYHTQCALCQLRHIELLDAAHIIPDHEPDGSPLMTNGLSLCKLHDSVFDSFIIGITPDYEIVVRNDVLEETGGSVLQYALKNLHKSKLILPASVNDRPNKDSLAWRFEKYKS